MNSTDPTGEADCPNPKAPCPIVGTAQGTGTDGHAPAGNADAQRMAQSGEYSSVHLDQKLSTITGDPAAGQQRPDVAGVRKDTGGVDTVEHPSKSQTPAQMDAKGKQMQEKLAAIGKEGSHETRTIATALKDAKAMRGAGEVGAMITAGAAAAAVIQNPTKQGVGEAIGDTVMGAVCGVMFGCGDAQ